MTADKDTPGALKVTVNGEEIPISPFVHDFITRTIEGMISALKDIPSPLENITIRIEKK